MRGNLAMLLDLSLDKNIHPQSISLPPFKRCTEEHLLSIPGNDQESCERETANTIKIAGTDHE